MLEMHVRAYPCKSRAAFFLSKNWAELLRWNSAERGAEPRLDVPCVLCHPVDIGLSPLNRLLHCPSRWAKLAAVLLRKMLQLQAHDARLADFSFRYEQNPALIFSRHVVLAK